MRSSSMRSSATRSPTWSSVGGPLAITGLSGGASCGRSSSLRSGLMFATGLGVLGRPKAALALLGWLFSLSPRSGALALRTGGLRRGGLRLSSDASKMRLQVRTMSTRGSSPSLMPAAAAGRGLLSTMTTSSLMSGSSSVSMLRALGKEPRGPALGACCC
uniref:Putative secreted protein n=1 Tax=Ixodes ricinus TaxID=34613 RepID=A0A6B0UWR2_IXORI